MILKGCAVSTGRSKLFLGAVSGCLFDGDIIIVQDHAVRQGQVVDDYIFGYGSLCAVGFYFHNVLYQLVASLILIDAVLIVRTVVVLLLFIWVHILFGDCEICRIDVILGIILYGRCIIAGCGYHVLLFLAVAVIIGGSGKGDGRFGVCRHMVDGIYPSIIAGFLFLRCDVPGLSFIPEIFVQFIGRIRSSCYIIFHSLRQPGDLYRVIIKGHAVRQVIGHNHVVGNAFAVLYFYSKSSFIAYFILVLVRHFINADLCTVDVGLRIVIGTAGRILDVPAGSMSSVIKLFGIAGFQRFTCHSDG